MFRNMMLGALGGLAMMSAASAADMPVKAQPPVFNWTGFYAGGTVGYGFGNNRHFNETTGIGSQSFDIDGFVGGLTVGYNWQARGSRWVWGVEFDVSYSDINGILPVAPGFGCGGGCTSEVKWFGTLRGRLGHTYDRTLLYVTGGLAFGEVEGSLIGAIPPGSETAVGWTVGAGIEFALAQRWNLKLEYLYVDLGDAQYAVFGGSNILVDDVRFSVARLGLNYRW